MFIIGAGCVIVFGCFMLCDIPYVVVTGMLCDMPYDVITGFAILVGFAPSCPSPAWD